MFDSGVKHQWKAYARSKFAAVVLAVQLNREGVNAVSVHPGAVTTSLAAGASHLASRWCMKRLLDSPDEAALHVVHCVENDDVRIEEYRHAGHTRKLTDAALKPSNVKALMQLSEELMKEFL